MLLQHISLVFAAEYSDCYPFYLDQIPVSGTQANSVDPVQTPKRGV